MPRPTRVLSVLIPWCFLLVAVGGFSLDLGELQQILGHSSLTRSQQSSIMDRMEALPPDWSEDYQEAAAEHLIQTLRQGVRKRVQARRLFDVWEDTFVAHEEHWELLSDVDDIERLTFLVGRTSLLRTNGASFPFVAALFDITAGDHQSFDAGSLTFLELAGWGLEEEAAEDLVLRLAESAVDPDEYELAIPVMQRFLDEFWSLEEILEAFVDALETARDMSMVVELIWEYY